MNSWTPTTPKGNWAEFEKGMTRGIFERVDSYRRRAELTVEELCKRLDDSGWPVTVSTMNGMLQGKRASVSIAEIFALARVLEVPPIGLIAPIERNEEFAAWPDSPADMTAYDVASWTVGRHVYRQRQGAAVRWSPTFIWLERVDSASRAIRRLNADFIARQSNGLPTEATVRNMKRELADLNAELRTLRDYGATPPQLPEPIAIFMSETYGPWERGEVPDSDVLPLRGLTTGEELEAATGMIEREIGSRSDFTPALYSDLRKVTWLDGTADASDK